MGAATWTRGDHVHYTHKRIVTTRIFDDSFRLMLKKIYSISRARVSFVEIKDKKKKNPHAFVSGNKPPRTLPTPSRASQSCSWDRRSPPVQA
jgi:hypothetical protein